MTMPQRIEQVDFVNPESSRSARFDIVFNADDGTSYAVNVCTVYQFASAVSFTAMPPSLGWQAWQSQSDPAIGLLVADAIRQAAELQAKWNSDTGRPAKEVFVQGLF
jgi:hypothetical protein